MYQILSLTLTIFCAGVFSQTLSIKSNTSIEMLKTELKTEFSKTVQQAKIQDIPLYLLQVNSNVPKKDSATLGIIFEPHAEGMQILSIRPNSAAAIANLTVGMIITHINGLSVTSQSNKSISHLFNKLRAIDSLLLKIKDIKTPLTLHMASAARYTPPIQLQIISEQTATDNSTNTSKAMQKAGTLTGNLSQNITQKLTKIAKIEMSAGKPVDSINFVIMDNTHDKISYQLSVGDYPDSPYRVPQIDYFNDGRIPSLKPCDTEQCRETYIRYLSLHSKNSGFLGLLRTSQFTTAGYGTQQKLSVAPQLFEMIAQYSDLPYANTMAGKLSLEHNNEPISASVFLRRAVKGEHPDPEALELLNSIYSNPNFDVIMPEEARHYEQLAQSYPMPKFGLSADEFINRELTQFPKDSHDFESQPPPSTMPSNEVIQLNGREGVYPYLVLNDLPYCQTDKCQHHFKSYFIVDKIQSSSNKFVTQMRLGEMYKAGYGIKQNLVRAMSFFEYPAKSNINYAQYQMAAISFELNKRVYYAKKLLKRAADAGYPPAMEMLSLQYDTGEFRDKDNSKASYWKNQYQASIRARNSIYSLNNKASISARIIKQLQNYTIDLDELFEVESKVLSKAKRYRNGRVFELPLTYKDKPK